MTKELEALERIKYYGFYDDYGNSHCLVDTYKKELDLIEIALKEHENDKQVWKNYLKEIKNLPPVEVQMKLKAFEIIKEKNVNVLLFNFSTSLRDYNESRLEKDKLIQEEFNLLKEVLK